MTNLMSAHNAVSRNSTNLMSAHNAVSRNSILMSKNYNSKKNGDSLKYRTGSH